MATDVRSLIPSIGPPARLVVAVVVSEFETTGERRSYRRPAPPPERQQSEQPGTEQCEAGRFGCVGDKAVLAGTIDE